MGKKIDLVFLIFSSLLILYYTYFKDLMPMEIFVIFWLESIVIVVFTFFKMRGARKAYSPDTIDVIDLKIPQGLGKSLLNMTPLRNISPNEANRLSKSAYVNLKESEKNFKPLNNIFSYLLFLLFFAAIFIFISGDLKILNLDFFKIFIILLSFIVSQIVSFINYLAGLNKFYTAYELSNHLFKRITFLFFVIIAAAIIVPRFNNLKLVLVIFVFIKMLFDIVSYFAETKTINLSNLSIEGSV